jgi:hypothetical protein
LELRMNEHWELTHSVKINPWARAIWEHKHPEGPVLVVWQLWPLHDYVAGWIPFAGRKCIPALVSAVHVEEVALVDSMVARLGEEAFLAGPSAKMIEHSRSIAAAYAANGKKGGRPRTKRTDHSAGGIEKPSQVTSISKGLSQPSAVAALTPRPAAPLSISDKISNGPDRNEQVWKWRLFMKRGIAFRLSRVTNRTRAWNLITNTRTPRTANLCSVEIVDGEDVLSPVTATPLENASPEECLAYLERVCAEAP